LIVLIINSGELIGIIVVEFTRRTVLKESLSRIKINFGRRVISVKIKDSGVISQIIIGHLVLLSNLFQGKKRREITRCPV
jgi:hypothetical protein